METAVMHREWLDGLRPGDVVAEKDEEGRFMDSFRVVKVTKITVKLDNGRVYRRSDGRPWGAAWSDRDWIGEPPEDLEEAVPSS